MTTLCSTASGPGGNRQVGPDSETATPLASPFTDAGKAGLLVRTVYLVEKVDSEDRGLGQLGAFDTEEAARECLAVLEEEGRHGMLAINLITVHSTVSGWRDQR